MEQMDTSNVDHNVEHDQTVVPDAHHEEKWYQSRQIQAALITGAISTIINLLGTVLKSF